MTTGPKTYWETLTTDQLAELRQNAQFHAAMQRGGRVPVDPNLLAVLLDAYEDLYYSDGHVVVTQADEKEEM